MHAQVSTVTLKPGKAEDWLAITRDSILPAAKERRGFVNALILIDREKNTGIGISLWETAEDADATVTSGFYEEQVAKAADCLASWERHVLEVAIQIE